MNISADVSSLKGVGPKLLEKLNRCGIFTILDLLLYFPRDYEYLKTNLSFADIDENEKQMITCKCISHDRDIRTKTGKILTTINFSFQGHMVHGKWFNQPFVKSSYKQGESYDLLGKFKIIRDRLEILNPVLGAKIAKENEILPKYRLKADLTDKILFKLITQALDNTHIKDNLPVEIVNKYKMCDLDFAIRNIHFPAGRKELEQAIVRLKFQELFNYSMKLVLLKEKIRNEKGIAFELVDELKVLKESLPFQLTDAQLKVVREIFRDQRKPYAMNRLVQGDVGSGKTIIAMIAMFNVIRNGYQATLMAPTEILAKQHYEEAKKVLGDFNIHIELLTGSTSNKEKKRIKELITTGEPLIVIGTHALIQEDVDFGKLGLVITDEQHRFGVEQRNRLINKGIRPDVIVMTATPIPRTLALYVHSDMDISIIDKLPPGRTPVKTEFFNSKSKDNAYSFAFDEISKGRQVYIVCPLIEEDENNKLTSVEKLYLELKNSWFKNIDVEILHGKMKAQEKEDIINRFKKDITKVLVSTTVIEVGVNVPNASIMIIENAERFGLAQLHQLRGRVGRGQYESYCFLIGNAKSEVTQKRMEIMTSSTDGFYISEEDLKLRGSGEMFGRRQSGEEGFLLADIYDDFKILRCARAECDEMANSNDTKKLSFCKEIVKNLERQSSYICFN